MQTSNLKYMKLVHILDLKCDLTKGQYYSLIRQGLTELHFGRSSVKRGFKMKIPGFRGTAMIFASTLLFAQSGHAAGGADNAPPKKTETTKACFSEQQWDPETNRVVRFSEKVTL